MTWPFQLTRRPLRRAARAFRSSLTAGTSVCQLEGRFLTAPVFQRINIFLPDIYAQALGANVANQGDGIAILTSMGSTPDGPNTLLYGSTTAHGQNEIIDGGAEPTNAPNATAGITVRGSIVNGANMTARELHSDPVLVGMTEINSGVNNLRWRFVQDDTETLTVPWSAPATLTATFGVDYIPPEFDTRLQDQEVVFTFTTQSGLNVSRPEMSDDLVATTPSGQTFVSQNFFTTGGSLHFTYSVFGYTGGGETVAYRAVLYTGVRNPVEGDGDVSIFGQSSLTFSFGETVGT